MDSTKLCECGCGQTAPLGQRTQASKGLAVGKPLRFVSGHQNRKPLLYDIVDCGYETPCWVVRGRREKTGYASITRNGRKELAHRVSYRENCGEIPAGTEVCHHCDNRPCIRPDHLFAGTRADNVHDMIAKGRDYRGDRPWLFGPKLTVRGTRHPRAVLSEQLVREIRRRYAAGRTSERKLAADLGVSRAAVRRVLTRTAWAWLD